MNRNSLIILIVSGLICCMENMPAYACVDEPPDAYITNLDWEYVKKGETVELVANAIDGDHDVDPLPDKDEITGLYWDIYKFDGSQFVYQEFIYQAGSSLPEERAHKTFNTPGIYLIQLWADDDEGWYSGHHNTDFPCDDEHTSFMYVVVIDTNLSMAGGVEFIPKGQTSELKLEFEPDPIDLCETNSTGLLTLYMQGYPDIAALIATPTGSAEWSGCGPVDLNNLELC